VGGNPTIWRVAAAVRLSECVSQSSWLLDLPVRSILLPLHGRSSDCHPDHGRSDKVAAYVEPDALPLRRKLPDEKHYVAPSTVSSLWIFRSLIQ
jgi:hypothetical protein